jgi:carboxylesterase type B
MKKFIQLIISISDLMFYYDLIRFLHERLRSESSASTYVYYYTYPPIFDLENVLRRIPNMVGHFAELDLIWGIPFFNRSDMNITYNMNLSYKPEEIQLSLQMIRYWTNFAKTGAEISLFSSIKINIYFQGNPNQPNDGSIHWPLYEKSNKSYINFHAHQTRIENYFLEERFQFWDMISHRPQCTPFRWYHTCLLVGILILVLLLISIYIFYNTKRSRRNIKPTEITTSDILTTYYYFPSVVS